MAAWRAAGSPRDVLMTWPPTNLAALQRLARRATVWLETVPLDAEEALDLAVGGAAHLVLRWPRDKPTIETLGPALGDLLAVACLADDAATVSALAPEAVLASPRDDGFEVPDPAPSEAEPADEATERAVAAEEPILDPADPALALEEE